MAYQNSIYETYTEVAVGLSLGVWLAGNYAGPLFKILDKSEPTKADKNDFFDSSVNLSGFKKTVNSFVLLNAFPIFTILFFLMAPLTIILVTVLQESTLFHERAEAAVSGHYLGEGFLFSAIYFLTLLSLPLTFVTIQGMLYDRYLGQPYYDVLYRRLPVQYQDRIYTACGFCALTNYNMFLLLTKIYSSDDMDQETVDNFLIAGAILPWITLLRAQPFIKGFYFFFPAFEFNEAYGGLILYLIVQYGGLFVALYYITLNVPEAIFGFGIGYGFVFISYLHFFYRTQRVTVKNQSAEDLSMIIPVRKALFDGGDLVMKQLLTYQDESQISKTFTGYGGVGLKFFAIPLTGGIPPLFSAYYTRLANEHELETQIYVSRRLKRFEGLFALPSVLSLFAMGLPLAIFLRSTKIKYYNQMNVLSELKANKEYKMIVSQTIGRSVSNTMIFHKRCIFVVDSPGLDASFAYYNRLFYENESGNYEQQIESFFLWKCSSFLDVMMVIKFLKSFEEKLEKGSYTNEVLKKPNFLITCNMTPYKFWAIRDYVDGTKQEFIKNKMLIGESFSIESLKPDNLFNEPNPEVNDQEAAENNEADPAAQVEDGEGATEVKDEEKSEREVKQEFVQPQNRNYLIDDTIAISVGSSALVANVKALVPRVAAEFYDVVFDHSITERNAWDPNGFFQVG